MVLARNRGGALLLRISLAMLQLVLCEQSLGSQDSSVHAAGSLLPHLCRGRVRSRQLFTGGPVSRYCGNRRGKQCIRGRASSTRWPGGFSQASDVTVARTVDALVLLQVLEHWCDPVATLRTLIAQLQPRWLLVSVPVSDSLLGVLSDPLVWPPHHQTLWSARALRVLGRILAAREIRQEAEPLTLSHFSLALSHEPAGAQTVLPQLGSWAGVRTRFILGRATGQSWSRWAHTRTALYRLR